MTEPTKPPADATHVCELRPRDVGTGFEIVSRTRILSWRRDAAGYLLPVTAYGVMSRAAFVPHATRPEDGYCFIECRASDGARQWVSPIRFTLRLTDAQVRGLLRNDAVRKDAPTQRLTPEEQRAMAMIKKHYSTQAAQQAQRAITMKPATQKASSSTQQLRREIEALKKRHAE